MGKRGGANHRISRLAGWAIGVFLLVVGVQGLMAGQWLAGFVTVGLALAVSPLLWRNLQQRAGTGLINGVRVILVLALLAVLGQTVDVDRDESPKPPPTNTPPSTPGSNKPARSSSLPSDNEASGRGRGFRMAENDVLADTFEVKHQLIGNRLTLALKTDLGDAASVMVTVSRTYREAGSNDAYSIAYVDQKSTVGAWRSEHAIELDNAAWKRELENQQRAMARAGEPFMISEIAEDVEVAFVVPVHQNPPLRRFNSNLRGTVVMERAGIRTIERRESISYPLPAAGNVGRDAFGDPWNLSVQTTYRASGDLPLVDDPDPEDPLAAIASMRWLPAGDSFTVLASKTLDGVVWYNVRTETGKWWINGTALLGKDLRTPPG